MKAKACIDELLVRGLDDWIQAAEVASVSRKAGGASSNPDCRALSLRIVRQLLDRGLFEIGLVNELAGFVPWALSVDAIMQRIEGCWPEGSPSPELGECFWLRLTAEGERQAADLFTKNPRKEI